MITIKGVRVFASFSVCALITACGAVTEQSAIDGEHRYSLQSSHIHESAQHRIVGAGPCAALIGTEFGSAVVKNTLYVQSDTPFGEGVLANLKAQVPFCRVQAEITPVPGSVIQSEVWLPDPWNGKLLGVGGGGFSGGLDSAPLILGNAIAKGYAGAATDAGHPSSPGARWAYGESEKIIDWAHRGNHLTAVFAKAVIDAYYGKPADHAYFEGCSNGGRDALMQAYRYPDDYDGIIAGAPATDWTGMNSAFLWNYQVLHQTPGAATLVNKIQLVNDAVLEKCDELDGVKDGVLENPLACDFDPVALLCEGGDKATCLTEVEVDALHKIYRGPRTSDGEIVFGAMAVGGEAIPMNQSGWIDGSQDGTGAFGTEFFRWMVYQDPEWTAADFELDRDYAEAVKRMGSIVDAHPDLEAFVDRGGKLIIYHGWYDARVQALPSITYYETLQEKLGSAADNHVRLFMAPGMAHCFAGPGPNNFDMLSELENWVERGEAPERVIATKYENDFAALLGVPAKTLRTRPLCAWPKVAHYTGSGSTDDAENFVCKDPD